MPYVPLLCDYYAYFDHVTAVCSLVAMLSRCKCQTEWESREHEKDYDGDTYAIS